LAGLAAFFEKTMENSLGLSPSNSGDDDELKVDPFTIILPIIVFIFDFDMRRVYRRAEKKALLLGKFFFWAFFYLIIGLAEK
jgi:hypothetical protein